MTIVLLQKRLHSFRLARGAQQTGAFGGDLEDGQAMGRISSRVDIDTVRLEIDLDDRCVPVNDDEAEAAFVIEKSTADSGQIVVRLLS